ncbi:hypothetical protein [Microbulbifer sp.]|uniref:hypothetical protein n=1 Tax=Microbulbifer sp. TaxID=1908541 RepID=UPI0025864F6E|nr:hypothetical protein [Microbulbifer sp.]
MRIVVLCFLLNSAFASASWPSAPNKPLKEMFSDSSFVVYAEAVGNFSSKNPKETLTKYKIIDVLKGVESPYIILRKEIYPGSESHTPSSEVYKTLLFLREVQGRKHYFEENSKGKPTVVYEGTVVFFPKKWNPDIGND